MSKKTNFLYTINYKEEAKKVKHLISNLVCELYQKSMITDYDIINQKYKEDSIELDINKYVDIEVYNYMNLIKLQNLSDYPYLALLYASMEASEVTPDEFETKTCLDYLTARLINTYRYYVGLFIQDKESRKRLILRCFYGEKARSEFISKENL